MKNVKRTLTFALIICFVLSMNAFAILDTTAAANRYAQYADCLEDYFSMREAQFNYSNASTASEISGEICCTDEMQEAQTLRNEFIIDWEDSLSISIAEAEITYRIEGIYSSTSSEIKLYVYEWVLIDYYCVGFDVLETMGFGTHHIITLCEGSENYTVTCDSYEEITGYSDGQAAEIAVLTGASVEYEEEAISIVGSSVGSLAESSSAYSTSYNASAAVSYAHTWCGNSVAGSSSSTQNASGYNPCYYYYPTTNSDGTSTGWGDCANFASQCIYAGGIPEDTTWYATRNTGATTPAVDTNNYNSSAWRGATELKNYLVNTKGYSYTRITSSSQAITGNLIYYSAPHIVIIVGTNSAGQVLIDGHTNDAYKYPYSLSNQTYYTICLQQVAGSAASLSSTQHLVTCKCGGHTWKEAHYWSVLADGSSYCVACGYMA